MREIKFRAWHEEYARPPSTEPQMLYDENSGDCLVWKNQGQPLTIMQFTGLLDKSDKEIYEGDVVVTYDGGYVLGTYKVLWDKMELKYFLSDAYTEKIRNEFDLGEYSYCKQDIEIIGNIYENPELLNNQ